MTLWWRFRALLAGQKWNDPANLALAQRMKAAPPGTPLTDNEMIALHADLEP